MSASGVHAGDSERSASAGSHGQSAELSYTLSQSIERGLSDNPRIRSAESAVRRAESEIDQQRGNFFPSFSAQTYTQAISSIDADGPTDEDYVDQQIDVVNFRLSQTLFNGLTVFNQHQKAVLNKAVVKARKKRTEMRLVLDIQQLFLDLLKAKEDVKSLRDAVRRMEVNVESAESYYEEKMAPYTQVLQAKVELADIRQELSQAENQVETARVQLNILLGFPGYRDISYTGDLKQGQDFAKSLNECLDYAYQHRPEMRIGEKSIDMARKEKKISLGQFSPRLSADADYYYRDNDYDKPGTNMTGETYDRDQQNTYWTVSLRLQWEFGVGGQQFHQHRKASHEIQRLKQDLQATKNQINAEVRTHYMALQEAGGRIDTTQTAVESAREGYARAKKRSDVRMGTVSELLDAQARLSRAEANYNRAIGDYLSSLAKLYHAMGLKNHSLARQKPST
ncbi:MAG: TolC family protein [Thermodesulfobacteriota bacterium]